MCCCCCSYYHAPLSEPKKNCSQTICQINVGFCCWYALAAWLSESNRLWAVEHLSKLQSECSVCCRRRRCLCVRTRRVSMNGNTTHTHIETKPTWCLFLLYSIQFFLIKIRIGWSMKRLNENVYTYYLRWEHNFRMIFVEYQGYAI